MSTHFRLLSMFYKQFTTNVWHIWRQRPILNSYYYHRLRFHKFSLSIFTFNLKFQLHLILSFIIQLNSNMSIASWTKPALKHFLPSRACSEKNQRMSKLWPRPLTIHKSWWFEVRMRAPRPDARLRVSQGMRSSHVTWHAIFRDMAHLIYA